MFWSLLIYSVSKKAFQDRLTPDRLDATLNLVYENEAVRNRFAVFRMAHCRKITWFSQLKTFWCSFCLLKFFGERFVTWPTVVKVESIKCTALQSLTTSFSFLSKMKYGTTLTKVCWQARRTAGVWKELGEVMEKNFWSTSRMFWQIIIWLSGESMGRNLLTLPGNVIWSWKENLKIF